MARDYSLVIYPGRIYPWDEHQQIHDRGYSYFKNTWERIFNRPNRPPQYSAMGFFRQDYVIQIENGGVIAAQSMATHYDLDRLITPDHPFFECWQGEPLAQMKSEGLRQVLSLEYTSVAREFSPRMIDAHLYKTIMDCSVKLMRSLDLDGVFGHPRRVTKTTDLVEEIGFKKAGSQKDKYGVSVDLTYAVASELTRYNDLASMRLSDEIWDARIDFTKRSEQMGIAA